MKKILLLILFTVSCSHVSVSNNYVKALILKAENERNPYLLREAFQKAGENTDLIAEIAIASGRIPDFYTYQKVAEKFGKNRKIADALAIASMFPGTNFPLKKTAITLSRLAFSKSVIKAMLNLKNPLALNIVLNRNKLSGNRFGKAVAYNLWRSGNLVERKVLEDFYKTNPQETVYSLYRLKIKGVAKAEDLVNADLNTKFYAMFVVDKPELLLDKNVWQLKVACIKAKDNSEFARRFLNSSEPLVKQVAIEYFLKNGGEVSSLNLDSLIPAQMETVLPYVKSEKIIRNIFKKGGFYSYVSSLYMPKNELDLVMNSDIPYYYKLKFLEKVNGETEALSKAVEQVKKDGDKQAFCYLIENYEQGKVKSELIMNLAKNNTDRYYSFLLDAGLLKYKPEKKNLAWYISILQKVESLKHFVIKTDSGDFKCKFFPKEAPLTCLNFYNLAKKGYFNGIYFHRVIPGFVTQGGDPTGTGYGGPAYSIRCEYNKLIYNKPGMIGMALAGKDTGGSQFFITHIATPHLDHNYTIFAEVTDGFGSLSRVSKYSVIKEIVF